MKTDNKHLSKDLKVTFSRVTLIGFCFRTIVVLIFSSSTREEDEEHIEREKERESLYLIRSIVGECLTLTLVILLIFGKNLLDEEKDEQADQCPETNVNR